MCVVYFLYDFLSDTFLILRRIQQDIIVNLDGYSRNVPGIRARF